MKLEYIFLVNFLIIITFITKHVLSDCGLPAIPYNAQIDRVQQIYFDGESVDYHCQLEELKLLGNSSRKCVNSQWVGIIPRCVEELHYGTISVIDLADRRNHSLEYKRQNWNSDRSAAYSVDYKSNKCLRSTKMSRPHSWKLHLTKVKRHISYIEILVSDRNGNIAKITDASKIIKYSKVNDMRECVPQVMETSDQTVRLSLTCYMEFDGDSKYEAWEKDKTQLITIEFDVDDITICEIRLFTNSFMPLYRCGSADVVLHSTIEFIKSGNKYSGNSYYRYRCDEGFQLDGPEDVRCGLNNHWLDPFPVCKPKVQCPYPPSKDDSLSVGIKTEHLYTYNGNISALVGSIIYYRCLGDKNNSIMIGDSVRVCGTDGKWTGVDPTCIHDSELNSDHFKEIKDTDAKDIHKTTFDAFNPLVSTANKTALACGIPAMPLFAKPTTSKRFQFFGGQSDLRLWYENGTVINYQCESAYRWVTGDVQKRTCINGQWVGRVGKCAVNYGNKVSMSTVYVYDVDKNNQWKNSHLVQETNSTSEWDDHFAYRRDADKGECATFTVESKHRWTLRLNASISITYFVVMLHPGGFFGSKRQITDPTILENSPVTASVGRTGKECLLTSAWDYSHSRFGTYFFFTCDMDEQKYRNVNYAYYVNLYIDPKKFDTSYTAKNVSLCSLAVMSSKNDCGTPDIPLHSTVTNNPNTHEWTFDCDEGYELVGKATVSCGQNGRWASDFPYCTRKELCPVSRSSTDMSVKTRWDNVVQKDNKIIAVIDTIVNHTCIALSKKILIGSQLRLCTTSGQWSGTEPYCMDPKDLPKPGSKDSGSTLTVFISVLSIILAIALVAGLVYYVFNKGYLNSVSQLRVPTFTIPKINIHRPSTVDPGRDTPHSFDNPIHVSREQPLPKQRSTKINENSATFSNGTEFLVEPDHEN